MMGVQPPRQEQLFDDRARWRVQIPEYLVSTPRNLQVLLRYGRDQARRLTVAMRAPDTGALGRGSRGLACGAGRGGGWMAAFSRR